MVRTFCVVLSGGRSGCEGVFLYSAWIIDSHPLDSITADRDSKVYNIEEITKEIKEKTKQLTLFPTLVRLPDKFHFIHETLLITFINLCFAKFHSVSTTDKQSKS